MALRIWLHEGHDGDPGVVALGLDHLGFATYGESAEAVLARVPERFDDYARWRGRAGLPVALGDRTVEVVDARAGGEIAFAHDCEPSSPAEVSLAMALLARTRVDLLARVEPAPPAALAWDPPYRRFAEWADWRTIRANLAHVANGETHYYLRNLGHEPLAQPAQPDDDWRAYLPRMRAECIGFLETLAVSDDLLRHRTLDLGHGEETWTVRKALRRLVSHERMHTKSIARILREYRARP